MENIWRNQEGSAESIQINTEIHKFFDEFQ